MPRAIWRGAISFGLVHIPVGVASATSSYGVDFDWLDQRSMDRVGYKRVNKRTGKEVDKKHIVKGVQYKKGSYVVLSEDEIRAAHPEATQTIDIFSFTDREKIPLPHIETPYFLTPEKRGEKVYSLLRETLTKTHKVALARFVLRTKEHLAALMPFGDAIMLVVLRWPAEVRSVDSIELGSAVTEAKLAKSELAMAEKLVKDMSEDWSPDEYDDTFTEKIMRLVEEKAKKGKLKSVASSSAAEQGANAGKGADIIDLTELLKRSLRGGKAPVRAASPDAGTDESGDEKQTAAAQEDAATASSKKKNTKSSKSSASGKGAKPKASSAKKSEKSNAKASAKKKADNTGKSGAASREKSSSKTTKSTTTKAKSKTTTARKAPAKKPHKQTAASQGEPSRKVANQR